MGWPLEMIKDPEEGIFPLLTHLADQNPARRAEAVELLGWLGDRRALDALCHHALVDTHAPVRAEAARALGEIGDPHAMAALLDRRDDPDNDVRWAVTRAIDRLTGGAKDGRVH